MMESQQHRLDQLTEHIVMYMQALNHPQLSDVCEHTHITECIISIVYACYLMGPQFEVSKQLSLF